MTKPAVSIVVANWEGEALLARALSSLQLSAQASGLSYELIVVDDASRDDSVRLVKESFPRVRLLVNQRNLGFGRTTMRGVHAAQGPVVILCNNDLVVKEPFVEKLVRWFRKRNVLLSDGSRIPRNRLFGVSARTMSWWDGSPNQLCMNVEWSGGRLNPIHSSPSAAARSVFVQAGAAAYDRRTLLKLGGLQDIFKPGYWEDYDLSYHAAKSGFVSLYDPEALALHHGGGSMKRRFGDEGVNRLRARNHLLFEWVNLTDAGLLTKYSARLAFSVAREWITGGPFKLTRAIADALPMAPKALALRLSRQVRVRDRQLIQ